MTVEELQVLISANADQFQGELIKVQQELRKLNKTTSGVSDAFGGNLFGTIMKANFATGLITAGISKVTNGMKGLIGSLIEGGSQYSRLRIATDTVTANLGITREQVRGLRDDLADANTYGINAENVIRSLALSGLIKMSEGLSAVDARTGKTVTGVTALTLAMKDLAAASAIDSSEGIERVSKFIQTGNTSFVDGLIELGNLGTEYRMYADSIGKARGELNATEEAQARMNIVMRESQKVWGAYANTYQTSGKALGSIRDITASIIQMIGGSLEPIFRVATNAILQFFVSIRDFVGATEGSIGSFANRVAGYMVALVRIIGRLLMKLPFIGKYFANLANFTVKPIQAIGTLGKTSGGAGQAVSGLGDAMNGTADDAKKLSKELAGLSGFDEMQVLSLPEDTGGSGGGGIDSGGVSGGGVGGGMGDLGLTDSSEEIMKYATEAEEAFNRIFSPLKKFLDKLKEIKIFGVPLIDILGQIAKVVGIGILAWNILSPIITFVVGAFANLGGVIGSVVGFFTSLNPVVLAIVAVIGLLVAGIVSAWQNSEAFRNSVTETFTKIQEVIGQLIAVFMEKLPQFQQALQPLIDAVGTFLRDAFKFLGEVVTWVWFNVLKPLVDFILANIVPAFSIALDVLIFVIKIFSEVASVVLSVVMPVIRALWEVFTTVFKAVSDIISWFWNTIVQPIFNAIWSIITGLLIPVFKNILAVGQLVWNALASVISEVWNKIYNAIKPVIDWIKEKIMPVVNDVKDKMVSAFEKIKEVGSNIWEGIKSAFKTGMNGIIDLINGFIRKVNTMIDKVNEAGKNIPGWSNISFRIGEIPKLAKGGVVTSPTLAYIAENGDEAVVPLENNTEWVNRVADLLNNARGGAEGATVIVKLGEKTIFEDFVDYVNDRSVISNKPILNV